MSVMAINTSRLPEAISKPIFASPAEERRYQKGSLAAACRALAAAGHQEGVAGHVTLRDPVDRDYFWVNPLLVPLSQMKASDLVMAHGPTGSLVDSTGRSPLWRDGEWGTGPGQAMSAAVWEHAEMYATLPEVNAIIHTHAAIARVFASARQLIEPVSVESATFFGDQILYEEFNGLAFSEEEGRVEGKRMAAALGGKHLLIEPNHGLMTVGPDVGSATWRMLCGVRAAQEQIAIRQLRSLEKLNTEVSDTDARPAAPMDKAVAASTHQQVGSDYACWLNWMPTYLEIVANSPEILL